MEQRAYGETISDRSRRNAGIVGEILGILTFFGIPLALILYFILR
jgi:hypothetical protein